MESVGAVMEREQEAALDAGAVEPPYVPRKPSDDELAAAKEVFKQLRARGEMGDDAIVSALLQIIDVLPQFTAPENWPAGVDEEYAPAEEVEAICTHLCRCRKVAIDPSNVIFLWRNKDKWMDGDRPRRGQSTKLDTRGKYLIPGKRLVLEVNYHHFLTLNPLQKLQSLYRLVRERDEEASPVRPDFMGFMDELELFGLRTFHDLVQLEYSLRQAAEVEHPYQLNLWSEE